jgi:hypothetical protein
MRDGRKLAALLARKPVSARYTEICFTKVLEQRVCDSAAPTAAK